MKWIKTDKHVYYAIYNEHSENLRPFATCTCPEGNPWVGKQNPYIYTEWGFEGSEFPIMRCIQTKQDINQKYYDLKFDLCLIEDTDLETL